MMTVLKLLRQTSKILNKYEVIGTSCQNCAPLQTRQFFNYFRGAYNKVDKSRLDLVGPDVTCAEWLMRSGAKLRWKDYDDVLSDYNSLPMSNYGNYKIEEIDFTGSSAMDLGFPHLCNLKHVKKIVINECKYVEDNALEYLPEVKDTLEYLQISKCPLVTAKGIKPVFQLGHLKKFVIHSLPKIKDSQTQSLQTQLQESLPKCNIEFFKESNEVYI